MKKLFLILSVAMFSLGTVDAFAQDNANEGAATEQAAANEQAGVAETPSTPKPRSLASRCTT